MDRGSVVEAKDCDEQRLGNSEIGVHRRTRTMSLLAGILGLTITIVLVLYFSRVFS